MTEEYWEQHQMDIIRGDDVPEPYTDAEIDEMYEAYKAMKEVFSGEADSQG